MLNWVQDWAIKGPGSYLEILVKLLVNHCWTFLEMSHCHTKIPSAPGKTISQHKWVYVICKVGFISKLVESAFHMDEWAQDIAQHSYFSRVVLIM